MITKALIADIEEGTAGHMDDASIIELLFSRSESAISELAKKYGPTVKGVARGILPDRRDAEECVNDTYLAVWNSVPPEQPQSLLAYCCRVARNIAIGRLRKNTAKKRGNYERALDEISETLFSSETAEDKLESASLARAINDYLGRLDTESRVMFVRRYFYSDDVRSIARRLDMTPNAVSLKLFRIRERLREFLCEEGFEI